MLALGTSVRSSWLDAGHEPRLVSLGERRAPASPAVTKIGESCFQSMFSLEIRSRSSALLL